jgi:hypothetical protein
MWIAITKGDSPTEVFDRHYALKCPHCAAMSNVSAISIPRFEYLLRFQPKRVAIGYRCDACSDAVILRYTPKYDFGNNRVFLSDEYEQLERPAETFEFTYLPTEVAEAFREALTCYQHGCHNAFAAMCRRCVQSVATNLGAKGTDRVLGQLQDLKDTAEIDDDTFTVLKQIIIDGHDGAHPHLPDLTPHRTGVLLELMKDVLYQLYVRKGKLQEAMRLRSEAIEARKA